MNYNSGAALSEPLLILVLITSMIFILHNKTKYFYLAFVFAGLCWWVRLEVIYPMLAVILIYFIVHRAKSNSLRNFSIGIVFLLITISPLFIQRDLQFDDPFYVWYGGTILADDYTELLTSPEDTGITDFVEKHGILGLMDRFANGLTNLFNVLFRILYPYLFILIPFGVLFSLRPIDQKLKHVKANWIMILALIGVLVIPFAIIDERRLLFALFPFLIILSTIPIQRVTNYGLSTFSFNANKQVAGIAGGGCVLTDDKEQAVLFRKLRKHGEHEVLGYNSKMLGMNAEFINFRLQKMDKWNFQRQVIAERYDAVLKDLPVHIQKPIDGLYHTYHKYVVRFETKELRDKIKDRIKESGIHYPKPIPHYPMYEMLIHRSHSCVNSNQICDTILTLPMNPYLTDEEIDNVNNIILLSV